MVQPQRSPRLDTGWLTEQGGSGLTVAVLGSVVPTDVPVLRRMSHHSGASLAIALDVDAWVSPDSSSGPATEILARTGWRSAPWGPRDRLETAWQDLGRSTSSQVRRAAVGGVSS